MVANMVLNQKNTMHIILDHINADAILLLIVVELLLSLDDDRMEINDVIIKYDRSNAAIMYMINPATSSGLLTIIVSC